MKPIPTAFAIAALSLGTACQADDGASSFSFNASATTDYRYRGISQSRLGPALQGGADLSTASGLYAGTWASTIQWIRDAGGDASIELDVYGGYKAALPHGVTLDVGLLHYHYPSHHLAVSPDTTEIYAGASLGVLSLKYSHAVTNLFGFADSRNSGYLDLGLAFDLGDGWTLNPRVGHQDVAGNDLYSYSDLAVGVAKALNGWALNATLVYADTERLGGTSVYVSPGGKDLGGAALTLGARLTF